MTQFLRLGARARIPLLPTYATPPTTPAASCPSTRHRVPRVDEHIPNHRSYYPTACHSPSDLFVPYARYSKVAHKSKFRRSPCFKLASHNICESHPQTHPSLRCHSAVIYVLYVSRPARRRGERRGMEGVKRVCVHRPCSSL